MRYISFWTVAALVPVLAVGCGQSTAPRDGASDNVPTASSPSLPDVSWQAISEEEMTAEQAEQKDRATKARDELMESLKSRLMDVVSTGGPVAAIPICKQDAPRLAAEISEKHQLRIGRTSFKLRNSSNQPPEWAKPLIERKAAEPAFLAGDGHLAALLPIQTGPVCLMCHGPREGIPEQVRSALAANYPDDQATGFEEGDLRGWFWVEVPGS